MNSAEPQPTRSARAPFPDLSLRQLRILRCIDDHHSLSAAARATNRTQSALSKALGELELKIGARLFHRYAHGVERTERGALLLARIREAEAQFYLAAQAHRTALRRAPRLAHNPVFSMDISPRRLAAFLTVYDTRNVRDAAAVEGITRAAVYDSLRTLESLLEVPLFEAGSSGLRSTGFADALAKHVRLAFALIQHGLDEIASLDGPIRGHVAIGTLPYSRTLLVPRAIVRVLNEHPQVAIRTREGPYDTLERALRDGSIDLIIGATRNLAVDSSLRTEDLFEDELAVICGAHHPLAFAPRVTIGELLGYGWVLPVPSTPARQLFDRFLHRRGVARPQQVVETGSLSTVRGLLLESNRLALLSADQVRLDVSAGLLRTLPIRLEGTSRPIGLTTRLQGNPSPAASVLLAALRDAAVDFHQGSWNTADGAPLESAAERPFAQGGAKLPRLCGSPRRAG